MRVGVLDVQGDVTEHITALRRAADSLGLDIESGRVRTCEDISSLSGLIIPGGESTTVGKLMKAYSLDESITELAESAPILGTCAGLVLLSKEGGNMKEWQTTLGLMDAHVVRNAFGRQRESFEAGLKIPALGETPYPGVFIRAPAIDKLWGKAKNLCSYEDKIVLAKQDNLLACAFHPELTDDLRLHKHFLEMI